MAKGLPKRKLEELITRWQLEKLGQVVVEGHADYRYLGLLQREDRCSESWKTVDRLLVESIEIPENLLEKHGLTQGFKQRAIAIAKEVAARGSPDTVRSIVDADLDPFLDINYSSENILYTDYSCMEGYMWTTQVLKRMLAHFSCERVIDQEGAVENVFNSISRVCSLLTAVRLARAWHPEWETQMHTSEVNLSLLEFNLNIDIGAYLQQCKIKREHRELALAEVNKAFEIVSKFDIRHAMNGHDLVWLLTFVIQQMTDAPRRLTGEEPVANALLAYSAISHDFEADSMFSAISTWAKRLAK